MTFSFGYGTGGQPRQSRVHSWISRPNFIQRVRLARVSGWPLLVIKMVDVINVIEMIININVICLAAGPWLSFVMIA